MSITRTRICSLHCTSLRKFTSASVTNDAVGPPHSISNLRPVLYDSDPQRKKLQESPSSHSHWHPYSVNEFSGDVQDIQWRISRQRLDAFNHAFWVDSNFRFEAGKQAVLSDIPESASTEEREIALSEFYKSWLVEEQQRQIAYTEGWNRRNFRNILLAARNYRQQLHSMLSNIRQYISR